MRFVALPDVVGERVVDSEMFVGAHPELLTTVHSVIGRVASPAIMATPDDFSTPALETLRAQHDREQAGLPPQDIARYMIGMTMHGRGYETDRRATWRGVK